MKSVLITGGAGFVGSHLALAFKQEQPELRVVTLDNLKRRGSELNLPHFKQNGIEFVHGDIRSPDDLNDLSGEFDLLIEASAEPSVLAGLHGSPAYAIQTNLVGTLNCLEFARKRTKQMIFLSTSRVYSMQPLRSIALSEQSSRFEIQPQQTIPGVNAEGISENFPTLQARSIYGATKLASEMMIQEYVQTYQLNALINRCGVIAGPGQFGKTDQGVFTLWVARHIFQQPLQYTGFGGTGKQVRDLLHPHDLYCLMKKQIPRIHEFSGDVFNVGGGRAISTSLLELTALCQKITGHSVKIGSQPSSHSMDVPLYISNNDKVSKTFGWKPQKTVENIIGEITTWIKNDENTLRGVFT